jgi:hypothetical protein
VFSPKFDALAGIGPFLSPVEPPVQPEIRAATASKSEGEGEGSRERFGAFTGLDLPKNFSELLSPGPDLQPMRNGLPSTPLSACQELMLAVVVQGLIDDDLEYVLSPTFIHHCCYIGLDPDTALNVKIKYLRREVDPKNLLADLHRQRRVLND